MEKAKIAGASRRKKPTAGSSPSPGLVELQDRFQTAILSGDDAALADIMDNSRTGREVLFGVYRNAYAVRLVEVISQDHDVLHAFLGDDSFDAMARAYIAAHPSRTQNARWFSNHIPAFLAETEPYQSYPEIADLARIEASLNSAFDAPDGPVIALQDIASIPPEIWGDLQFKPHSSATRLNIKSNALDIWRSMKDGVPPPEPVHIEAPVPILVWRQVATPVVRELTAEEAMMWDEAVKGVLFSSLCEMAAIFDKPDEAPTRVAGYFAGWLGAGLLSQAQVQKTRKTRTEL